LLLGDLFFQGVEFRLVARLHVLDALLHPKELLVNLIAGEGRGGGFGGWKIAGEKSRS